MSDSPHNDSGKTDPGKTDSGKTDPGTRTPPWELSVGPPPSRWDDWVELDPQAWPERREVHYRIVPTICFNCESACGLLAFVDKSSGEIKKFEGNPVHPGSRGRTCAKGPATLNQIRDPERILFPLKRSGPRGSGQWERVSWEEALKDIGSRVAAALDDGRGDEVMYHVGRPGEDHFATRVLQAWGVDGHNSHTNVCSASARLGYTLWLGADRPSPDFSESKFVLLLSAHLETGHYFNPHAQRIIDAKSDGARIAVVDTRLSNTSTHADHWVSTWPGTESALLLGIARELLVRGAINTEFMERWIEWRSYLASRDPEGAGDFQRFVECLRSEYDEYNPEMVEAECKLPAGTVATLADEIARAGTRFSSHVWRNAAAGHEGGWQVARCLLLLHAMTGSIGTPGGVNPNSWDKHVPHPPLEPPAVDMWNERQWPREYPLAHYEMSFVLPHLLERQNSRLEVYFSRVYNPVWTNPDGCSWIEMFEHPDRIGLHVALTPTWNETAQWADYVLPMGMASERHDVMSQETHAGTWIGFRQPVGLQYERLERDNTQQSTTLGVNPGEVWEEAELWVALSWQIDPDGKRGIRRFFESPTDPSRPITMDEYFGQLFETSVPGLPEAAASEGLTPLEYMRRYGAFAVPYAGQERYEGRGELEVVPGDLRTGFPTRSGRLEILASTLEEWSWGEHAMPGYIKSQVNWEKLDLAANERCLLPTFRLPTLIHTRSANSKWLQEISHTNPLWVHPDDASSLGLAGGALVRVVTEIGHFVVRAWVTQGIHPGVVACSHHVGRWRLQHGGMQLGSSRVRLERDGSIFRFRAVDGVGPHASPDPDTERVFWREAGVNQNLTFPVQPDPISGMHCWHQKVRVERALPEDRYGDIVVDTSLSRAVFERWLEKTRPASGEPGSLRRPLHLKRPLKPTERAYRF